MSKNHCLSTAEILAAIEDGDCAERFRYELEKVAQEVSSGPDKCAGSLTLTVSVKKFKSGQVILTPKIVAKMPERIAEPTSFFVLESGGLSRRDQKQLSLIDSLEVE